MRLTEVVIQEQWNLTNGPNAAKTRSFKQRLRRTELTSFSTRVSRGWRGVQVRFLTLLIGVATLRFSAGSSSTIASAFSNIISRLQCLPTFINQSGDDFRENQLYKREVNTALSKSLRSCTDLSIFSSQMVLSGKGVHRYIVSLHEKQVAREMWSKVKRVSRMIGQGGAGGTLWQLTAQMNANKLKRKRVYTKTGLSASTALQYPREDVLVALAGYKVTNDETLLEHLMDMNGWIAALQKLKIIGSNFSIQKARLCFSRAKMHSRDARRIVLSISHLLTFSKPFHDCLFMLPEGSLPGRKDRSPHF